MKAYSDYATYRVFDAIVKYQDERNYEGPLDLDLSDAANSIWAIEPHMPRIVAVGSLKLLVEEAVWQKNAPRFIGEPFEYRGEQLILTADWTAGKVSIVDEIDIRGSVLDAVIGGSKISVSKRFFSPVGSPDHKSEQYGNSFPVQQSPQPRGHCRQCSGSTRAGVPCRNLTLICYRTNLDLPFIPLCWRHKQQIILLRNRVSKEAKCSSSVI